MKKELSRNTHQKKILNKVKYKNLKFDVQYQYKDNVQSRYPTVSLRRNWNYENSRQMFSCDRFEICHNFLIASFTKLCSLSLCITSMHTQT